MQGKYTEKQLVTALRYCKGDPEKALDVLLSGELKQVEERSNQLDVPQINTQQIPLSNSDAGRSSGSSPRNGAKDKSASPRLG